MHICLTWVVGLLLAFPMFSVGKELAIGKGVAEEKPLTPKHESVTLLRLDWTSQQVITQITGKILKAIGVSVDYLDSESKGQWFLLNSGEADVQMEVWEGTMAKQFDELVAQGRLVDAGHHDVRTREDWWYPAFVATLCPGLPHWEALNDCEELFATDDSKGKGVYYSGPWEKPDRARIRALKLNYKVVELPDGKALNEKILQAMKAQQPILIFNWSPNWVDVTYEGAFVEFPDYEAACETDPAWGINREYPWDCGNPANGWLKKTISRRLLARSPCSAKIIKTIQFNTNDLAEAAYRVDIQGKTVERAASLWMAANTERWKAWLKVCD